MVEFTIRPPMMGPPYPAGATVWQSVVLPGTLAPAGEKDPINGVIAISWGFHWIYIIRFNGL
jgi:hypothetical protein